MTLSFGDPNSRTRASLTKLVEDPKVPGLVVLGRDEEGTVAFSGGFANIESGLAPTPDTVFGLGSTTKAFTGLCLLRLVADGELDLFGQVKGILGSDHPVLDEVTVHHLLTHTSGLPPLDARFFALDRAAPETFNGGVGRRPHDLPQSGVPGMGFTDYKGLLDYLGGLEIDRLGPPGRWFSYSNEGYILLSGIVAETSGMSFEDYCKSAILEPLGLTRTAFIGSPEAAAFTDVATPYSLDSDGRLKPIAWWDAPAWGAPGGLLASARDLLRAAASIQHLRVPGIPAELLATISAPHAPQGPHGGYYGYGLLMDRLRNGWSVVRHSGGRLGTSSQMKWLREKDVTAVAVVNVSDGPLESATTSIVADLCGVEINEVSLPSMRDLNRLSGPTLDPDRIVGIYRSSEGNMLNVAGGKEGLSAQIADVDTALEAVGADLFVAGELLLKFKVEGTGPAWGVEMGSRILTRQVPIKRMGDRK